MTTLGNRFARGAMICAAFAMLMLGGIAAANDIDPAVYQQYDVGNGRVTLDVQDAAFGDVVRQLIQPRTRVNIFIAPEALNERVTIRAVDLHWSRVLSEMTRRIGGVMITKDRNLIQVEKPPAFSYSFDQVDIKEIIDTIVKFAEASVVISPKVEGKLTMTVNALPWREALRQAVETVGPFTLIEGDYGVIRVVAKEELEPDFVTYRFRYLRPPAPYKGVISNQNDGGSGSGGSGGGSSSGSDIVQHDVYVPTDDPAQAEDQFPLIAALREIVKADNGTVRYSPTTNTIFCTGLTPTLQRLLDTVRQLDVEPPQVFIDMSFVVTSDSDAINLGLEPGSSQLGLSFGGSDITHMLPFAFGDPGGLEEAITGTEFNPVPASSFSYGTLTTNQSRALYNFIQRDSTSRIIQAPKLLALDGHEATIFIGEQIRYARSTATTDQNGGLVFGIEEDPNSPVNVGFQLLVIPHVIPGEQKIMLHVIPQRRTLTGNTSDLPGFDRFTIGTQSIDLPRVQSNTLVTHMILGDGQTAVIGGLLEDRDVELVDKVPFFGDLPLAGLLFQGKEHTKLKEHLLITITPRILRGTDATNCVISNELLGRSKAVSAEWSDVQGRGVRWPGQGESLGGKAATPPPPAPPAGNGAPIPVAPGR